MRCYETVLQLGSVGGLGGLIEASHICTLRRLETLCATQYYTPISQDQHIPLKSLSFIHPLFMEAIPYSRYSVWFWRCTVLTFEGITPFERGQRKNTKGCSYQVEEKREENGHRVIISTMMAVETSEQVIIMQCDRYHGRGKRKFSCGHTRVASNPILQGR